MNSSMFKGVTAVIRKDPGGFNHNVWVVDLNFDDQVPMKNWFTGRTKKSCVAHCSAVGVSISEE